MMIIDKKANRPATEGEIRILLTVAGIFMFMVLVMLFGGHDVKSIENCSSYGVEETGRILGVMMCKNGAVIEYNSSAYVNQTVDADIKQAVRHYHRCGDAPNLSCAIERQITTHPKELLIIEHLE